MIAKIIFFAFFAVAFAQDKGSSDVNTLKRLTDEAKEAVENTLANINVSPEKFDNIIKDRYAALMWEGVKQKQNFNSSITEAVFKGLSKDKQFKNFQCISNGVADTHLKFDNIISVIPNISESIKEVELSNVMWYKLMMEGFHTYIEDLFTKKCAELKKATSEDAKRKILEESAKKIKFLKSILDEINNFVKDSLFKFFEIYINFAFTTEKNLVNTQREGAKAIMKCVS